MPCPSTQTPSYSLPHSPMPLSSTLSTVHLSSTCTCASLNTLPHAVISTSFHTHMPLSIHHRHNAISVYLIQPLKSTSTHRPPASIFLIGYLSSVHLHQFFMHSVYPYPLQRPQPHLIHPHLLISTPYPPPFLFIYPYPLRPTIHTASTHHTHALPTSTHSPSTSHWLHSIPLYILIYTIQCLIQPLLPCVHPPNYLHSLF
jgi:hypothetical protein